MSKALDTWRERLSGTGLPVFARTVREVSSVAADDISSARDLSDVVSRDAAMASRLIHIANSSLFNLQDRVIETISSAVVLLGFDAVRDLAVSVSVIDKLLKGQRHERVIEYMTRSFHAAAHAKTLSGNLIKASKSEEIFVAGLMRYVGEMAFWSMAHEEAARLDARLDGGEDLSTASKAELGFDLADLSAALADDWHLGDLARHVHQRSFQEEDNVACVVSGHELVVTLEKYGWDSPECEALMARLSERFDIEAVELRARIEENIEHASALAEHFGVRQVRPPVYVPPTEEAAELADQSPGANGVATTDAVADPADAVDTDRWWAARGEIQLDYLNRLAQGLEDGAGRDELMTLLVEGLLESLQAQRAWFALLSPDRRMLVVKYAVGSEADALGGMKCSAQSGLFGDVLTEKKPRVAKLPAKVPWHGGGVAYAAGVRLGGKPIGLLYADIDPAVVLDEARALNTFRQFSQQVGLVLMGAG